MTIHTYYSMSYALCNGVFHQSVYFNRFSGVCEYYLAEWDDGETAPQFNYANGTQQWTFYYTNGEQCDGVDRKFNVNWKCDPTALPFSTQTQCEINDAECFAEITILSAYACVDGPPPQTECKWGNFDLTSVFESGLSITCNDITGKAYQYTPCRDAATCDNQQFQATLFDDGNCLSLAQWDYGLTEPSYFNNGGTPAWMFNYRNGAQTPSCPDGIDFRVSWECNFQCDPWCLETQCSQINECGYSLTIQTILGFGSDSKIGA